MLQLMPCPSACLTNRRYKVLLGGHTQCAAKLVEWQGRQHSQLHFMQVGRGGVAGSWDARGQKGSPVGPSEGLSLLPTGPMGGGALHLRVLDVEACIAA